MEGCPRQPPSRFQQHGRFGGVAGRSWALPRAILGAFALKLGLPGGAKWANPVLQGLFFERMFGEFRRIILVWQI